jgi:chromate reductase, NAD(P)H dehydrogenase (quinone)
MGASSGPWGARLAQAQIRQTLAACGALVMPAPHLYIRNAAALFDHSGSLADPATRDQLRSFMAAFARWITLVTPGDTMDREGKLA